MVLRIKYYEIVIYRKFVHLKQSFWFLNFLLGFLLFSQRKARGDKLTDNEKFFPCCAMNPFSSFMCSTCFKWHVSHISAVSLAWLEKRSSSDVKLRKHHYSLRESVGIICTSSDHIRSHQGVRRGIPTGWGGLLHYTLLCVSVRVRFLI